MSRHVEIAGAGFAGLVAAIALMQRGWTARVHERTPIIRSEGFGIAIHENGLRVLDAIGMLDRVLVKALRINRLETRDRDGRSVSKLVPRARMYRISRQHMVQVLSDRVRELGGEVLVDSPVSAADADGALLLENGKRLRADLVLGADGYNSRVRDSVDLLGQRVFLADGAMRLTIPRLQSERDGEPANAAPSFENWSGKRRLIYNACSADEVYIAMSCLARDTRGKSVPIDADAWKESFPHMADVVDRIAAQADWRRVMWVRFQIIKLRAWSRGRVAILGDAASAMPPNLGQGGGCAMMNALALAVALENTKNQRSALEEWERRERPLTEHTQRWSRIYSWTTAWPDWLRSFAFGVTFKSSWLRARIQRTATHVPTGCRPIPASSD